MQKEIWKEVKGYEGSYQVSNFGRVKSCSRIVNRKNNSILPVKEKILKSSLSTKKYPHVALSKKGILKTKKIHRLVAYAFIPNPENKPQVNHLDGIKTNNYVSNLEWCTNYENKKHSLKMGLQVFKKGSDIGTSKLKEKDIVDIRNLFKNGDYTKSEIANIYKMSKTSIHDIIILKNWKHVK